MKLKPHELLSTKLKNIKYGASKPSVSKCPQCYQCRTSTTDLPLKSLTTQYSLKNHITRKLVNSSRQPSCSHAPLLRCARANRYVTPNPAPECSKQGEGGSGRTNPKTGLTWIYTSENMINAQKGGAGLDY